MKFLKPNQLVGVVYNDGVVELNSKVPQLDEYSTPIPGKYDFTFKHKSWFRMLGITSQEDMDAKAFEKKLVKKIGIPGNKDIDSKLRAFIGTREFEIYRSFYNYKNDETELSLVEVEP